MRMGAQVQLRLLLLVASAMVASCATGGETSRLEGLRVSLTHVDAHGNYTKLQLLRRAAGGEAEPPPQVQARGADHRRADDVVEEGGRRGRRSRPAGADARRERRVPDGHVHRHAGAGVRGHHRHRQRPGVDAVQAVRGLLQPEHARVRPVVVLHLRRAAVLQRLLRRPAHLQVQFGQVRLHVHVRRLLVDAGRAVRRDLYAGQDGAPRRDLRLRRHERGRRVHAGRGARRARPGPALAGLAARPQEVLLLPHLPRRHQQEPAPAGLPRRHLRERGGFVGADHRAHQEPDPAVLLLREPQGPNGGHDAHRPAELRVRGAGGRHGRGDRGLRHVDHVPGAAGVPRAEEGVRGADEAAGGGRVGDRAGPVLRGAGERGGAGGGAEAGVPLRRRGPGPAGGELHGADSGSGTLCLTMMGSRGLSIIGNFQQQNIPFVYDVGENTLSFAPVQCAKL